MASGPPSRGPEGLGVRRAAQGSLEQPFLEAHVDIGAVLRPPVGIHQHPVVEVIGRQVALEGLAHPGDRGLVRRAIGHVLGEGDLLRGLGEELERLHRRLAVLRALRHHPEAGLRGPLRPVDLDALLGAADRATDPDETHARLAAVEKLLGLRAGVPPHDVVLDRVELLQRALDIQRIELLGGHAVGQQRGLEDAARRVFPHRAHARELLEVEEVLVALRRGGELGRVIGQNRRLDVRGDAVGAGGAGDELVAVHDRVVDRLEPLGIAVEPEAVVGDHDVPVDRAAFDHRLQLGVARGAVLTDGDLGVGGGERREIGLGLGLLIAAAIARHGEGGFGQRRIGGQHEGPGEQRAPQIVLHSWLPCW
ncbi:hypothetical protein SDC9_40106 [bioreactor metagenome]|uniref:Uncharacterized protein n=1 Tax=bioreactor metagenome TaxID=1076179 RepID=A0A644VRE3_9ZZZZ